jgi:hypothetical protein
MKYIPLIIALLVVLSSCRKDKGKQDEQKPLPPLVKKMEHYITNVGTLISSYTYQQERLQTIAYYSSPPSIFYEYRDEKVLYTEYSSNGTFYNTATYELDENGYIRKFVNSRDSRVNYYKVRPDGFLESEVSVNSNGMPNEQRYYYNSTGVLDSMRAYANGFLKSVTTYTAYDMGRVYTISNDNFGKSFLGRKFKYPPLKSKVLILEGGFTVNVTNTYTYDSQGRIIKDERVASNSDNYIDTYEYY